MAVPAGPESEYDVVMVCGGRRCQTRTEEILDSLREVVRASSASILMRTECQAGCLRRPGQGAGPDTCQVLLQRVDAQLRPAEPFRRLATDHPVQLRTAVARWLMRAG